MSQSNTAKPPAFLRALLPVIAVAALAASNTSNAAVIASWDAWADSSPGSYNADTEFAGFQGVISVPEPSNRALTSGFGSTDGTFGSSLGGAATTDDTGLLVRKGNTSTNDSGWNIATITLTNDTGSAFNIESVHFDLGVRGTSGDAFTLSYTSGGLGAVGTIGSATGITDVGNQGNYDDFNFDLTALLSDFTLGDGESAVFTLVIDNYGSNSASSVLDNVAFQGAAVPEPSSALLLGLAGSLALLRKRRV